MLITHDSTEHAIRMHGFVTVTDTSNNGNLHGHVDHFAGDYAQGPPTHAQFGHIVADNSTAIFSRQWRLEPVTTDSTEHAVCIGGACHTGTQCDNRAQLTG